MARFAALRPHLQDGVPLARAAGDAGVAVRTAQRWLARYRACGLAGLARASRADTGRRRLPAELAGLIEGLALRKARSDHPAEIQRLASRRGNDRRRCPFWAYLGRRRAACGGVAGGRMGLWSYLAGNSR